MSMIDHPDHYTKLGVEVIDIIRYFDFRTGNAVKYLLRAPFKGSHIDDLKKCLWYLDDLLNNNPKKWFAIVLTPEQAQKIQDTKRALVIRGFTKYMYALDDILAGEFKSARDRISMILRIMDK